MKQQPEEYRIKDNGVFPNSSHPVLHYKGFLKIPLFLASWHVKRLFSSNNWSNNWQHGIYTYNHYHSITHEAIGVCKGATTLQLGGDDGILINIQKGDVIIIPAGVAHKNLGDEDQVVCVGGYPDGKDYDMNYGKAGERPKTDRSIAAVPLPDTDPVLGKGKGVATIWKGK